MIDTLVCLQRFKLVPRTNLALVSHSNCNSPARPISILFHVNLMSKGSNDSKEVPPAKQYCKPAGFRLARPGPSQPSTSLSSNTSVFVTVSQPDEWRGTLQAQTRVLPSQQVPTIDPTTPSSSSPLPVEPVDGSPVGHAPPEEETVKPKRKRYTMNTVC